MDTIYDSEMLRQLFSTFHGEVAYFESPSDFIKYFYKDYIEDYANRIAEAYLLGNELKDTISCTDVKFKSYLAPNNPPVLTHTPSEFEVKTEEDFLTSYIHFEPVIGNTYKWFADKLVENIRDRIYIEDLSIHSYLSSIVETVSVSAVEMFHSAPNVIRIHNNDFLSLSDEDFNLELAIHNGCLKGCIIPNRSYFIYEIA